MWRRHQFLCRFLPNGRLTQVSCQLQARARTFHLAYLQLTKLLNWLKFQISMSNAEDTQVGAAAFFLILSILIQTISSVTKTTKLNENLLFKTSPYCVLAKTYTITKQIHLNSNFGMKIELYLHKTMYSLITPNLCDFCSQSRCKTFDSSSFS